jgi:uncharacterized membrane protein
MSTEKCKSCIWLPSGEIAQCEYAASMAHHLHRVRFDDREVTWPTHAETRPEAFERHPAFWPAYAAAFVAQLSEIGRKGQVATLEQKKQAAVTARRAAEEAVAYSTSSAAR